VTESPPPVETVDEGAREPEAAEIDEPAGEAGEPEAAPVPEPPQIVAAQLDALSDMDDAQAGVLVGDLGVAELAVTAAEPQLPVVTGETAVSVHEVLDPLTAPLEVLTAHGVALADLPLME
jgi:hypothetical protein